MKNQYFHAIGKRKCSIASVRLHENGSGEATVNGMPLKKYFFGLQSEIILSPLVLTNQKGVFDLTVEVVGGGKNAQADAIRHGISRALTMIDPRLRPTLKKAGFMRRDSRIRERKKPGLKRARRAPQWAKR